MAKLRHPDILAALLLLALPLVFFRDTLFFGKVLLPTDNLFQWEPWRSYAAQFGVGGPRNQLLSDLILENYPWKRFIVDSLQAGELPLWNPYLFAGVPFLAAGQHSALYPPSVLFYLLPVANAFAYGSALNFFLGGLFMYLYLRAIDAGRTGALVGGLAYAFSGFMVVSVVFPMVISAAVWLPLLLMLIERALRRAERGHPFNPLLPAVGAAVVGIQFLAGHVEISLYVLLTAGFYTACRLVVTARLAGVKRAIVPALQALAMVVFGAGLAAVQLVPLYELVTQNFRQTSASYEQVVSWAYTWRNALTFLIPDLWGNPSHTSYFNLILGREVAVTADYAGRPIQFVMAEGVKNYVEAGAYLGVLPLLLAVVAVVRVRNRYTWIFLGLAVISLLMAFGTPIYKVVFYLVPGWKQLHTPFRWVFPYTLCLSALAGLGAGWLAQNAPRLRVEMAASAWRWFWRLLGWAPLLAGGTGLLLLLASLMFRSEAVALADGVLQGAGTLQYGFASGQMLYSYQFRNFAIFASALVAAGLVIVLATRGDGRSVALPADPPASAVLKPNGRRSALWRPLTVAVVALELFVWGSGFNPATDPALLDFTPDAVAFLQADRELYRVTGYGDDSLHPNTAMIYGIADVRGYDSIIPKQYTDYMGLIEEQKLLDHNRVARLGEASSLDSPLLDLLNVKYVVSGGPIERPGYRQVYDGEINIYQNEDYLPRAFVVHQAEVMGSPEAVAEGLRGPRFDPRHTALLETAPGAGLSLGASPAGAISAAEVTAYGSSEVTVRVDAAADGLLLLADTYFSGWKATVDEQPAEILRADYNFRAVAVPAGSHEVVFRYRPDSLIYGGFVSLVAGASLALILIFALWSRFYRESEDRTAVQRVAKNSLTPMISSFANKGVDFVFAMLMLRVLGPEDLGKFTFAIVITTTVDIVTNFGLNTLLTREVAKQREAGNSFLSNTAVLRLILLLIAAPLLAVFLLVWRAVFDLADDTILACALLMIALAPAHISAALSSLFLAHERMEYPAGVSMLTTLVRVALGLLALLLGWGFVGLAGVAVATNFVTMAVLLFLTYRILLRPRFEFAPGRAVSTLRTALPLMLNQLLAVVFFRIDIMILQPIKGDLTVGWYGTAYKFIDGLNIIPATFTFAIFPLLSRYAASARDSLYRSYSLALKYLLIIAFPIAVGTTVLAEDIIMFFGGPAYLPHAAIALQILIWFLPFSYVNGVTQYVLIALDEQRYITYSFLIAVPFNIVGNLILIPLISYQGAAVVTILSEVVLLTAFMRCVHRHLPRVPLFRLAARPALAALAMGAVIMQFGEANPLVVVPLGAALYLGALLVLRTFDAEDRQVLRQLLGRGRGADRAAPARA